MLSREVCLLLVDDDPFVIQAMARMLAQYPDQRFATSGEAALRIAREANPDLIVLDVDMPGMSGFEVCDALKADPDLAHIPVIFVTSHSALPLQVAALQKGAVDFISKPLVAAQLTARVRGQLRSKLLARDPKRSGTGVDRTLSTKGAPTPRILIVDDDPASIHVLRHTLQEIGELHFAQSGQEALQIAARLVPDLIVLDAQMPGVDGFEVCKSLKALAHLAHMPIAFVTRLNDPRHETRAFELGAADYISKPYTAAVLQARVRNLLDLKRRFDVEMQAVREHWRRVGDERVAELLGAASDAIVTCDADDNVVLINDAACRMFGVGQEQAIGFPASTLFGDDLSTDNRWSDEPARTTLARSNGDIFPVEPSLLRIGEGADRLTTVMLRDISDRERLKSESRSRLESESASHTKTLMMLYIAHEMGNPLNALLGTAKLMATDTEQKLPAEQAQRLEYIITCGAQLQSLMRDVIDLGRFETGNLTIDLSPVDANHCAQEALAAVSPLARPAGVALSCSPVAQPFHFIADARRLHQCLVNLLTNSVKYVRPGGWARIEMKIDVEGGCIAVRDNGPGIDELQRQRLFEPFDRLGRERGAAHGTGLGLVITRHLVEAMKGRLRVESELGHGSCFSIFLPGALGAAADGIRDGARSAEHRPIFGPGTGPLRTASPPPAAS